MARDSEPQGCLAFILNLFGIKLEKADAVEKALPYRLRDDFLSRAEFSFYSVLVQSVGSKAVVCPKVNLADIFFVSRPNENQRYRNKIDRKHVDFLLCDPATGQEKVSGSGKGVRVRKRCQEPFYDSAASFG